MTVKVETLKDKPDFLVTDAEYMTERMKKELLGKTITEIVISDDQLSFGFKVDNDLLCWVDRDPEGNGCGWLAME